MRKIAANVLGRLNPLLLTPDGHMYHRETARVHHISRCCGGLGLALRIGTDPERGTQEQINGGK
jgi:hypothetical protein